MKVKRAPRWAIALSVSVSLAGAFVVFVVCQAFFTAFVVKMRVFFPFLLSPVIAGVSLWWLATPWITVRRWGRAALINLVVVKLHRFGKLHQLLRQFAGGSHQTAQT